MILKYFVLSVLFICSFSNAGVLDDFIESSEEQEIVVEWVKKSTNKTINDKDASKIVKEAYANAYSRKIDPLLVMAVMRNESNFRANASSKDGSRGLMQVIPRWHKDKLAGRDALGVTTSIDVGTWVLKDCLVKHKGVVFKALSCYSGGGGKVYYDKVIKHQNALTQTLKQRQLLINNI